MGDLRPRIAGHAATAALTTCSAFLVLATSAAAHAYPVATRPATGGLVKASPQTVSITYDESVSVPSLAVYSATGKRVSGTTVTHPAPDRIAVTIPKPLADGTYTVAWRVTSADTHIVHGVYTFSVGKRGSAGAIGAKLLARNNIPEGLSLGFGIVRFLNLALMLLCGGGAITLLWPLHDGDERIRQALLRGLVVAASALALVAVLGLPFQAAEANGTGLGAGFTRLALDAVRRQRFGELWLVRAWLAVVFALLALSLQVWKPQFRRERHTLLAAAGIGLLITSTDSGHASVSGTLAFIADAVHITAAAVWLGGLAFVLAAIALSRPERRWELASRAVPRFSLMALLAVPLLGAAGIVLAYLQVSVWRGLWQTTYGALVLTKIGVVLPLLALAAYNNRRSVPALRARAAAADLRARFIRAAGIELVLLLAIIGVTAGLVDEAPAKTVLPRQPAPRPAAVTESRSTGPFKATLTLRPALAGKNTVEMRVTSRRHLKIGEVDLAAVPTRGAPVNLDVIQVSSSRFRVRSATLSKPGHWELEMTIRQGLTEWLTRIPVTIQAGSR